MRAVLLEGLRRLARLLFPAIFELVYPKPLFLLHRPIETSQSMDDLMLEAVLNRSCNGIELVTIGSGPYGVDIGGMCADPLVVARYLGRYAYSYPRSPENAAAVDLSLARLQQLQAVQHDKSLFIEQLRVSADYLERSFSDEALFIEGFQTPTIADFLWEGAFVFAFVSDCRPEMLMETRPMLAAWWQACSTGMVFHAVRRLEHVSESTGITPTTSSAASSSTASPAASPPSS